MWPWTRKASAKLPTNGLDRRIGGHRGIPDRESDLVNRMLFAK
jgi:hypothetical protein